MSQVRDKVERDENNCREDLTPTEIVEIGRAIEALEKPKAKERQGTRTDIKEPCGKFPQGSEGKTRDKVGAALGVSGKTYEKPPTKRLRLRRYTPQLSRYPAKDRFRNGTCKGAVSVRYSTNPCDFRVSDRRDGTSRL